MTIRNTSPETCRALYEALETIAGGYTDRFPGAPDVMADWSSPLEFRAAMWSWSQKVARAALRMAEEEAPEAWDVKLAKACGNVPYEDG